MEKLINKKLTDVDRFLAAVRPDICPVHAVDHKDDNLRNVHVSGMSRTSDMLMNKRTELLAIYDLLKTARNSGDAATKAHYEDLILRIANTLEIKK